MRVLSDIELSHVSGGDNPGMGPYGPGLDNGAACANTVMAWGGLGSTVGGAIGGLFGGFGGMVGGLGGLALGGGIASRFSSNCRTS